MRLFQLVVLSLMVLGCDGGSEKTGQADSLTGASPVVNIDCNEHRNDHSQGDVITQVDVDCTIVAPEPTPTPTPRR